MAGRKKIVQLMGMTVLPQGQVQVVPQAVAAVAAVAAVQR